MTPPKTGPAITTTLNARVRAARLAACRTALRPKWFRDQTTKPVTDLPSNAGFLV
jgi:hypothetical protein